jgi:electron transport complex protein RnfC
VQYYRYAKSEIIAIDKAKEAADMARERNDFRIARIEREKLERAQKHAERAQAGKAEVKPNENTVDASFELNSDVIKADTALTKNKETVTPVTDKQAAIAAAIARAKAQKLATTDIAAVSAEKVIPTETPKTADTNEAEIPTNETQAKLDKQALIAAAIERAKAQKLAALQAGIAPKNIENVSATVQAEINEIDAIRKKVEQTSADTVTTKTKS